ncbi:hypothetical protein HPB51_013619 [Rhipicephalus microplus]|uniref:Uncharacterized protein n=1 Tax=Rhipicephalus microplus TaxID=6941 RepID=A0A9J6EGM9_RHIMP|nr:hypothetical protein HPB51_013619 [Rhipicephalus microplus]
MRCYPKRIVLVWVSCLGALSTACLVKLIAHSISALSYSLLTLRHVLYLEDMMTELDGTKPKTAMFASHNPSKQFNALLLRILRIQLGIWQQQREVLQEVRQLKHERKHLLQIGGRGLREIGVNAMKAVLAHDVQVLYSLHGRKGKRAFVNLRLCRLMTDVIRQKAGCDQAEALNFIKRWLPGSCDRCGGRKRRF